MISITKDKIFYSEAGLTGNKQGLREVQPTDTLKYISEIVEFEDGLTFGRLFQIIIQNRVLINMIYHSTLGGFNLQSWIDEFNQPGEDGGDFEIVFSWGTDYSEYQGKIECTFYPQFGGFGSFDKNDNEKCNLGMSFTKLCDIKNKKVKLDTTLTVDEFNDGEFKRLINSDYTPLRLFDVFYSILFEISFHGEPTNRDAFIGRLDEQSKEINDAIENGTIDEITTPAEEVFKEFGFINTKPSWKRTVEVSKTRTFIHNSDPRVLHIIETGWNTPKMYSVIIEDGELGYPEMEFLSAEQILQKFDIDVT